MAGKMRGITCNPDEGVARTRAGSMGLLTDKTSWLFRDLRTLTDLVGVITDEAPRRTSPFQIASVGCSRGEEVYSLMAMMQVAGVADWEIAGYDISRGTIRTARNGMYRYGLATAAEKEGDAVLKRYGSQFVEFDEGRKGVFVRLKDVERLTHLGIHDLTEGPLDASVDALLCRNILFHYRRFPDKLVATMDNVDASVNPGGYLIFDSRTVQFLNDEGHLDTLVDRRYTPFDGRARYKILRKADPSANIYPIEQIPLEDWDRERESIKEYMLRGLRRGNWRDLGRLPGIKILAQPTSSQQGCVWAVFSQESWYGDETQMQRLRENPRRFLRTVGYIEVPRPIRGDVVGYSRFREIRMSHWGRSNGDGNTISKLGVFGPTISHPTGLVPFTYGDQVCYFRKVANYEQARQSLDEKQ